MERSKQKKNERNPKPTKLAQCEEKTETLSSLIKKFDSCLPSLNALADTASNYITQTKLQTSWPKINIKIYQNKDKRGKESAPILRSVESVALNSAEFLEKTLQELSTKAEKINEEKDEAKEFARNCFIYLNKVHNGTCLGEAGKIMLKLFDDGNLSGNIIFGLIERAEKISLEKDLPFANKLSPAQSKAINFMVEERDTRIAPTIENLQIFLHLYKTTETYTPLVQSLASHDFKMAERIINQLP
jgi:hypothetical protein